MVLGVRVKISAEAPMTLGPGDGPRGGLGPRCSNSPTGYSLRSAAGNRESHSGVARRSSVHTVCRTWSDGRKVRGGGSPSTEEFSPSRRFISVNSKTVLATTELYTHLPYLERSYLGRSVLGGLILFRPQCLVCIFSDKL